jgi:hypothetical protein
LEDDGEDRGLGFIFMGTDLLRQFEFIKTQWINDGNLTGLDDEKDPLVGAGDGAPGCSPSPRAPSADGCSSFPASWSPTAVSTCSCLASGP